MYSATLLKLVVTLGMLPLHLEIVVSSHSLDKRRYFPVDIFVQLNFQASSSRRHISEVKFSRTYHYQLILIVLF